jgi:hypothetical protein
MAYAFSTKVLTADSNATSGNATLIGTFQANTVKTDVIVANGNSIEIQSNVVFDKFLTVNNNINATSIGLSNAVSVGNSTANVVITSTGVNIGGTVVANTSTLFIGNSTVNSVINSTSYKINGQTVLDSTNQVNTNVTASTDVVDYFAVNTYRAAEYIVTIKNNSANQYQMSKLLVMWDGTNVLTTEYGVMASNGLIGTFSANANSTHSRLYCTLVDATDVQIKAVRTPVPV